MSLAWLLFLVISICSMVKYIKCRDDDSLALSIFLALLFGIIFVVDIVEVAKYGVKNQILMERRVLIQKAKWFCNDKGLVSENQISTYNLPNFSAGATKLDKCKKVLDEIVEWNDNLISDRHHPLFIWRLETFFGDNPYKAAREVEPINISEIFSKQKR